MLSSLVFSKPPRARPLFLSPVLDLVIAAQLPSYRQLPRVLLPPAWSLFSSLEMNEEDRDCPVLTGKNMRLKTYLYSPTSCRNITW